MPVPQSILDLVSRFESQLTTARLPAEKERFARDISSSFLGIYAGLIDIQHGIFEISQGDHAPGGLMFNAIGPPCQPEMVWHACFPAMSFIPNLFITGIAAVMVGLLLVVWAAAFARHAKGALMLGGLSLLALLVGGGFVPVFIGLVAAFTSSRIKTPVKPGGLGCRFVSGLWPWPLVLMAFWLPGSWLLGHFFNTAMLSAGGLLFLIFDISLPILAAVSAVGRTNR